MKKNLLILTVLFSVFISTTNAQFAVGYSVVGNVLTFKLKPSVTTTTDFSTIEFFVRYPTATPAFTYGAVTPNTTNFPAMTALGTLSSGSWEIERDNAAYAFPGYHVDHFIYTGPAPTTTTTSYTANQVYDVISVPLIGTSNINFELVHQSDESIYYLALTNAGGSDLRPVLATDFFFPTTLSVAGPSSSTIYYAGLLAPLPVKFLGFTVTKNNNAAILNWSVENEDAASDKYEILRSTNGFDFETIATIAAKNNGSNTNTYSFTQDNLSTIRNTGVIYFRIKQIDKDGKAVITEIKNVRLTGKGLTIGVYPNPIKQVANVSFDLEKEADVILSVLDASGKQIITNQFQGFKGPNIKSLDMAKLASGSYLLKIQNGTETKTMPIVKGSN
jgi:hypothetical protein